MSKALKKKVKNKGSSFKKWKEVKNNAESLWFQNITSSGQSSPKMSNKMNTTAPINFRNLGVTQMVNNKGSKDSGINLNTNLEKTMAFGTATKRSFSNKYYTKTHGGKVNSNSRRMSYKVPSGLSNISDNDSSIVPKGKTKKFKISSNRGSTKPAVGVSSNNQKENAQLRIKTKMQTAPTSPSGRTTNEGSTVKIRNSKEIEYKSFIQKEEKVRK